MNETETVVDQTQTLFTTADADGRVLAVGHAPRYMVDTQPFPAGGCLLLDVEARVFDDYVKDGQITARPVNSAVMTGTKITQVPNPATVAIDGGMPAPVTDGEIDLTFTQPGTYTVVVSSWPMLDAIFTVIQA